MPGRSPHFGKRLTRREACRILGISRSTFYARIRRSPDLSARLDVRRRSDNGHLTMDRQAVLALALEWVG